MTDAPPSVPSPQIRRLLHLSLLLAVGTYLCPSIHAPAFFEHLTIGQWILSHAAVPVEDLWTLAGEGKVWRSTSWLFDAGVAAIERSFGEVGLITAKMIAICFLVWSLAACFSTWARDCFFGTGLGLLVACGILARAPFEPYILGIALFARVLDYAGRLAYEESRYGANAAGLLISSLFAANLHGSSIGAILIALLVCWGTPRDKVRPLLLSLPLLQLITPYGGMQAFTAICGFAREVSFDIMYQASAATIFDYGAAFLLLLWILSGVLLKETDRPLRASLVAAAAGGSLLGISSSGVLASALLLSGLLCASLWPAEDRSPLVQGIKRLEQSLLSVAPVGVLWVLLCAVFVNVYNLLQVPVTKTLLPRAEVDLILEQQLPFPLLHEGAIGPYIVYRFADAAGDPRNRAAATPRIRVLDPELASAEHALEKLAPGWERYWERIAPKTVLCRTSSALYELLMRDPNWKRITARNADVKARSPLRWAVFYQEAGVE